MGLDGKCSTAYYRGMTNTPVTAIRLPLDLKERIEAEAAKEGRNVSNMLIRLAEEALAARRKRK